MNGTLIGSYKKFLFPFRGLLFESLPLFDKIAVTQIPMADLSWSIDLEETASIGNIARKVMSYGTTSRSFDGNEMYITHNICSTDTLQGIALKYGVTVSAKRLNEKSVETVESKASPFFREQLSFPFFHFSENF